MAIAVVLLCLFVSSQAIDWSKVLGKCVITKSTQPCLDGSLPMMNPTTCKMECPTTTTTVSCLVNPCQHACCPNYPDAICRPNYVDCRARFFDKKTEKEVDCSRCPAKKSTVNCFADPCHMATQKSCPGFPGAQCISNYCDGCNKDYCWNGRVVQCGMDCSIVSCAAPPPCDHGFPYVPEGKCCPVCPDCSTAKCNNTAITCPGAFVPAGGCCKQCPDCPADVNYSPPFCGVGIKPVTLPGKCHPECPTANCTGVVCPPATTQCRAAYFQPGQCCPTCPVNPCDNVRCAPLTCDNYYTPPGECCPKCPVTCNTLVACPAVKCSQGVSYIPPNECCPRCPDCSTIDCMFTDCTNKTIKPGECCCS